MDRTDAYDSALCTAWAGGIRILYYYNIVVVLLSRARARVRNNTKPGALCRGDAFLGLFFFFFCASNGIYCTLLYRIPYSAASGNPRHRPGGLGAYP